MTTGQSLIVITGTITSIGHTKTYPSGWDQTVRRQSEQRLTFHALAFADPCGETSGIALTRPKIDKCALWRVSYRRVTKNIYSAHDRLLGIAMSMLHRRADIFK